MNDSENILLIAIGFAAVFGLQGALNLAAKHLLANFNEQHLPCNKIILSKKAFFAKIPLAYLAVIFYIIVIVQLFLMMSHKKIQLFWFNFEIIIATLITFYYAYIMFFELRIICKGCIRIYLANILMAIALTANHFL